MSDCFLCDVIGTSAVLHMGQKHMPITSGMGLGPELDKNQEFNAKLQQVIKEVEAL